MDFPYFKILTIINDPKEGIAKSRRDIGELVINKYYWRQLKEAHKVYVLCHEEGHIFYNTVDELKADDYASKKYLEAGYPISESVKALSEHLDRSNPVHMGREWAQYNRALKYDFEKNNNKKAFRSHYESSDEIRSELQKMVQHGK